MTAFADIRRIGWDTETTGTNVAEDRIVTAAIVVRGGNKPGRTFSYLINPGIPIPEEASELHGVTDAKVQADGRNPKEALDEIATHLAAALAWRMPVVAFNHSFDWSILHHDLVRNGLPTVEERVGDGPLSLVDPHVIDKQYVQRLRGKGMRKLKPTAERYGVHLEDWHTAEADALAALLIAEAQFAKYQQLNAMGPQHLFAAQRAWRAEQQISLQEFLRQTEPEAYCAPEWPLIPAQRGGEAS